MIIDERVLERGNLFPKFQDWDAPSAGRDNPFQAPDNSHQCSDSNQWILKRSSNLMRRTISIKINLWIQLKTQTLWTQWIPGVHLKITIRWVDSRSHLNRSQTPKKSCRRTNETLSMKKDSQVITRTAMVHSLPTTSHLLWVTVEWVCLQGNSREDRIREAIPRKASAITKRHLPCKKWMILLRSRINSISNISSMVAAQTALEPAVITRELEAEIGRLPLQ